MYSNLIIKSLNATELPLLWEANQTSSIHAEQLVSGRQTSILKRKQDSNSPKTARLTKIFTFYEKKKGWFMILQVQLQI